MAQDEAGIRCPGSRLVERALREPISGLARSRLRAERYIDAAELRRYRSSGTHRVTTEALSEAVNPLARDVDAGICCSGRFHDSILLCEC
jgi:hypothetical protein